jgi:hypothetical protein
MDVVADDIADDRNRAAVVQEQRVVPVAADIVPVGGRQVARRQPAPGAVGLVSRACCSVMELLCSRA